MYKAYKIGDSYMIDCRDSINLNDVIEGIYITEILFYVKYMKQTCNSFRLALKL